MLAIDEDEHIVQRWSDRLAHVVQADSTDEDALRQLGVADLPRAIVGIGTDIEASVLTVLALNELGVREIWAKAISAKHGKILSRSARDHVVYPEAAMGERVAHLITSRMLDFIEFDDGYAIAKVRAPREAVGKYSGRQSQLRTKYGITVVAVKMTGADFAYAQADTVVDRRSAADRGRQDRPGGALRDDHLSHRSSGRVAGLLPLSRLPDREVPRCSRPAGGRPRLAVRSSGSSTGSPESTKVPQCIGTMRLGADLLAGADRLLRDGCMGFMNQFGSYAPTGSSAASMPGYRGRSRRRSGRSRCRRRSRSGRRLAGARSTRRRHRNPP